MQYIYIPVTYFITGRPYLLISFTCFTHLHAPSTMAITGLCSVSLLLLYSVFFFRFHIQVKSDGINIYLFPCDLIYLAKGHLGPSRLLQMARLHSFL